VAKRGKRRARKVKEKSIDKYEAIQDEGLEILDCIEVIF
jgi:hypothetical protein